MLRFRMAIVPETSCQSPSKRPCALEIIRRGRGLSREGLAAAAGVSARTIYNIEVKGRNPRRATKRVLCNALGRTVEEVFLDPDRPGRRVQLAEHADRPGPH